MLIAFFFLKILKCLSQLFSPVGKWRVFLHTDMYHVHEKSTCKAFTYSVSINVISEQHVTTLYKLLYVWMAFVISFLVLAYYSNLDNIINTGNVRNLGNFSDAGNFRNAGKFSNIGNRIQAILMSGRWHKKLNLLIVFSNSIFMNFFLNSFLH